MSLVAKLQTWSLKVSKAFKAVKVLATDVPDNFTAPVSGMFFVFDPNHFDSQDKFITVFSYLKRSIVLVNASYTDENGNAVKPGLYGANVDIPINKTTGIIVNWPNFPESLQTQPPKWHFLCHSIIQVESCTLGKNIFINASSQ